MKRLLGWRGRPARLAAGLAVGLVLLAALATALYLQRAEVLKKHVALARQIAQQEASIKGLESSDEAAQVVRFGMQAQADRVTLPQSAVEITYALEQLRVAVGASHLATHVGEPVPRRRPLHGYTVNDRGITLELGVVTEASLLAFLAAVPASLNGVVRVERLDVRRRATVDEALLSRVQQGQRPDVLAASVKMQVATLTPAAPAASSARGGRGANRK